MIKKTMYLFLPLLLFLILSLFFLFRFDQSQQEEIFFPNKKYKIKPTEFSDLVNNPRYKGKTKALLLPSYQGAIFLRYTYLRSSIGDPYVGVAVDLIDPAKEDSVPDKFINLSEFDSIRFQLITSEGKSFQIHLKDRQSASVEKRKNPEPLCKKKDIPIYQQQFDYSISIQDLKNSAPNNFDWTKFRGFSFQLSSPEGADILDSTKMDILIIPKISFIRGAGKLYYSLNLKALTICSILYIIYLFLFILPKFKKEDVLLPRSEPSESEPSESEPSESEPSESESSESESSESESSESESSESKSSESESSESESSESESSESESSESESPESRSPESKSPKSGFGFSSLYSPQDVNNVVNCIFNNYIYDHKKLPTIIEEQTNIKPDIQSIIISKNYHQLYEKLNQKYRDHFLKYFEKCKPAVTFHQFLHAVRIAKSIDLLNNNEVSRIKEAYLLLGYKDNSTFDRNFKEIMDSCPSDFLKTL